MNDEENYDHNVKLLIIGDSSVGKSSIIMRYAENNFSSKFYNTIGVDFKTKETTYEGKRIHVQIWDTAGQERFRTITSSYYRGAHGILMVYDISERQTFDHIRTWSQEIAKFANENVVWTIVGNKLDLSQKRQVTFSEAKTMASQFGVQIIQTSAKSGDGVSRAFEELLGNILSHKQLSNLTRNKSLRRYSGLQKKKSNEDCCC